MLQCDCIFTDAINLCMKGLGMLGWAFSIEDAQLLRVDTRHQPMGFTQMHSRHSRNNPKAQFFPACDHVMSLIQMIQMKTVDCRIQMIGRPLHACSAYYAERAMGHMLGEHGHLIMSRRHHKSRKAIVQNSSAMDGDFFLSTLLICSLALVQHARVRKMQALRPSDDDREFWVSQIQGFKVAKGGKILYRVRWWGYAADEDTDEPVENLDKHPMTYRWASKSDQQKCAELLAKRRK